MGSGGISLRKLTKVYAGDVVAVDAVDLEIGDGEFMVLVGPSGCGKSTLLRLIAGLEETTDGTIAIAGKDVTETPPQDRDIAMVFQNYALYPHMTVEQNLAFGLRIRGTAKEERKRRVHEVAGTLGLLDLLNRKPAALSGGQRQRVAIGRAMVREPVAFLMDEPLSNLDAKLRVSMRASLTRLHAELGVTTVYVTHDQIEAMTLGQRVAVMRDGRVQQVDTPQRLFDHPTNLFVAAFIGSPSMNLVEADVDDGAIRFAGHALIVPDALTPPTGRMLVGLRPTDFENGASADPALPRMRVQVSVVEALGAESHVIFHLDAPRVRTDAVRAAGDEQADDPTLFADDERAEFTARIAALAPIPLGAEIDLAVHVERAHFFDAATGEVVAPGSRAARSALRAAT
jgi:multiple sugar transport system ATP-binding protein